MHIFVDALDPELVAPVAEAIREERPIAIETAISGSEIGTKRLVSDNDLLARGENGIVETDDGEVFVNSFAPRPNMYVFGAVDHAAAVADIGRFLGFRVTVCDARAKFATRERFPNVDDVVVEWPDRFLGQAPVDERTAICVLTHDHKFDVPLLKVALESPAGYIGAMGSRRTNEERAERLRPRASPTSSSRGSRLRSGSTSARGRRTRSRSPSQRRSSRPSARHAASKQSPRRPKNRPK